MMYPYHFEYSNEYTVRASKIGDISELKKIPYGKITDWKRVNYIKNHKVSGNPILIMSDSSFLKLENQILPFIFSSSSYMQAFNKLYIDYDFLVNAIEEVKPDTIVYSITERTLKEKKVPKDPILRILGRYALGMNENFIFPEDLSSPYTPISYKDGYLSVNDTSLFPLYINKNLKTDNNGDIYISFRYSFPKNADEAVLEWTSDKEFKTDIKRSSVKISGGGCKV